MPATDTAALAPMCHRCGHRHLSALPCWAGRYVGKIRALVIATYGDTCCHCGKPGARSVEHVIPRAHGGTDALSNLLPAHLGCNLERGTRPMAGYQARPVTAITSPRW
jgi:5-methylcytosine-specific restriction endonuclease McrA